MPRSRGARAAAHSRVPAAVGAGTGFQELLHPLHALLVLDLGQGIFHGVGGVEVGEIQLRQLVGVLGVVEDVLFHRRALVDDLLFPVEQLPERHIGAHAHGPADIHHQRPHQRVPGGHGALLDGQTFVRHQGGAVHRAHHAGTAAGAAGTLAVEGQLLGAGGVKMGAALGTDQLLPGGHRQGGRQIMPVGAAMAGQTGEHQPQTVQKLGAGAEGAADARHTRPLVQGQRGGHIQHLIHRGLGRLGHAPAGVGGQGLQIAAGPFRVEHPQCQRGFPRTGHTGNSHNFIQRHVHIHVFQVVHPRAADLDGVDHENQPPYSNGFFPYYSMAGKGLHGGRARRTGIAAKATF